MTLLHILDYPANLPVISRNKNRAPTFSYCGETGYEAIFAMGKKRAEKRYGGKRKTKRWRKEEKNNE